MKKVLFVATLFLGITFSYGQEDEAPKEGWTKGGTFTFLLNQSAFSNWVAGGQNNVSGTLGVNYDFNYLKGDWTWDNKIMGSYGLTNTKDQGTRKTDDRFEYNSQVGKKAFGNWYYSFFLNFRTQFTNGYDYNNDADTDFQTSGLFKPAYLTFGPGLAWKKHDNLKFNLAPLTSKMTFITDEVFKYNSDTGIFDSSDDADVFGIDPGDSMRYELGFYASGYYKFNAMDNVSIENILNLYSNYLEDPKNIDVDYTMNVVMKINKYLSTNLTFQAVYDDNAISVLQIREVFGLGVNVGF
ncbi:DUF3078 domain-containing protein [Galbibacter sp. EGI 63066]|uniref:DUF3078 domain-containing protein n=1 Tax=Galbibacter sp. EGI 63066 TaxID=2993559 RepID=UPI002248ADBB|nr:DUF3078 domain-containing protein [Galbibacter sp. EGI 63066]MCX2681242.1 DUF3078 domain-containing protein [Galbibacter sp. EGI 63066]